MTDLHPTGAVPSLTGSQTFLFSVALAVDNGQQVGFGTNNHGGYPPDYHALLWNGTSTSTQDLHPADPHFIASAAYGLANNVAVGVGVYSTSFGNSSDHALAWRGAQAANMFDLHNVLPPGYLRSGAYGVGMYGDVVGYARANSGINVPVRWMYRPKVTKPPYEIGPREELFPVNRLRGEGFIITEVRVPKEGGIVKMTSEVPSIVSVPDSVRIGGEEDAALFLMTFAKEGTYPKGTVKSVTIRATYQGIIRETIVKVVF